MDLQASTVYNSVETAMFSMYEHNSGIIHLKLQELMEVLDRIGES